MVLAKLITLVFSTLIFAVTSCNAFGEEIEKRPDNRKIEHVFVIVLENEGFENTFSANSPATYLSKTLPAQGALLRQYFGIGHNSLDNYIAMISGQAPNPQTQQDCQTYSEFQSSGIDSDGQAIGRGCVYPKGIKTLPDQLIENHLTWKSYNESMANSSTNGKTSCIHPSIGASDAHPYGSPSTYVTKHNPFMYFHSIIDDDKCSEHVVDLNELKNDLGNLSGTPNFVFITPNLCHDGHDTPCIPVPGAQAEPGGLLSADDFLKQWIPVITSSEAFRRDGLLIVMFDEAEFSCKFEAKEKTAIFSGDSSACCNEKPGPNSQPGMQVFECMSNGPGIGGPGGGLTGAVLLSPFIKAGTVSDRPYNHYSQLKSIEDIFGLKYLGYAGQEILVPFGDDVFTNR